MKPRQLQFFLLEFTLSLVILSVALVVALNLFTISARQHTQTLTLRTLSQTMAQEAEWLRHPDSDWALRYPQNITATAYDVRGHVSDQAIYTLTVTRTSTLTLETATLVLKEGEHLWLTLRVVRELTP
jgi:Tfp pilus assembly protein PilV